MPISFVWLYMFKCDVYAQILVDQTQKDFWVFYLFLKVILYFRVLCFVQNAFLCFFFKNWFRGCLARSSRLRASHEKGLREMIFFILSHRNSRYRSATTSRPTASREILLGWKWIFPKSDRSYHYCLATVSRPKASRESWCALLAYLTTVSLFSNQRKTRVFSF